MPFAARKTNGEFLCARSWIDSASSPTFGRIWDKEHHAKMFVNKYNHVTERMVDFRPQEAEARQIASVVPVRLVIDNGICLA